MKIIDCGTYCDSEFITKLFLKDYSYFDTEEKFVLTKSSINVSSHIAILELKAVTSEYRGLYEYLELEINLDEILNRAASLYYGDGLSLEMVIDSIRDEIVYQELGVICYTFNSIPKI